VIFNFRLRNHHDTSLNSMGDLLEPIWHGLMENGHQVIRFGTQYHKAPAVNLLLEFFRDDEYVEGLLRLKREHGESLIFGLVCTEDPQDALVMDQFANRRPNLERLLPIMDFVWTLLPVPSFFEAAGALERTKVLHYGFSPSYLDKDLITDPVRRDLDTVLYGNEHGRRAALATDIRERGAGCVVTSREFFPSFMTDDLIRRSKLVLDLRRGEGVRFLSPTRIVKALHSGTLVLSERFDTSEIATLYDYTVSCPYEEMAERAVEIVRSGNALTMGLEALARFKARTSMAANVAEAMRLPIFDRLLTLERAAAS
jgi:hypothetical protein